MERIIFVDVDDTLFPTSYYKTHTLHTLPNEELRAFDTLGARVIRALKNYGNVTIVTRATAGWFESLPIPQIHAELKQCELCLCGVSGKYPMFQRFAADEYVSIGDGREERDAVLQLPGRCKSILFLSGCSPDDMIHEYTVLLKALPEIMDSKTDVDLEMTHHVK